MTTARWRDDAPRPPGPAVVVDIDGVLADARHREHLVTGPGPRRWQAFFAACDRDPVVPAGRELVALLAGEATVVLLSSRPGWVFERTERWLERHDVAWHLLVLRGAGPTGPAGPFKRDVLASLGAAGFVIEVVLDDDARVVTTLREAGHRVVHVRDLAVPTEPLALLKARSGDADD